MYSKKKLITYINSLLDHKLVKQLDLVNDKGISVLVHTYDVLKIVIKLINKNYGSLESGQNKIDYFAILIGVILHDTTKGSLRLNNDSLSHSMLMKKFPGKAELEVIEILKDITKETGIKINEDIKNKIIHIVLSHHGQWGKVKPTSIEAKMVHEADKYSACYHRINPIGAKKIVKLMSEGNSINKIVAMTNQTEGIILDRLKRAKKELRLNSNKELLEYYKSNQTVPDGDEFFSRRIKETESLVKRVEKVGFSKLILENPLIDFINDKVFIK